ncbi:MAG TPA: hypothetical protein VFX45_01500 [Solirubrobacterales bacterium]|nr:hypothetical protein [Solirubrobacterales bacterium]
MVPQATRPYRRLGVALLATVAIGVASVASSAAAETAPPEAPAAETPKMKLVFPTHTAKLAGPGALVSVKCVGAGASSCIGTLALRASVGTHEVAYELARGERRTLIVPLGEEDRLFASVESAEAVARTMQDTGISVRTGRVLHIR